MKPTSLQNAIKEAALKKAQRRDKSGWKEPEAHVHKITAKDLEEDRKSKKGGAMAFSPAAAPVYAPPAANPAMLQQQQQLLDQMKREKEAWGKERDTILKEMKDLRSEMGTLTKQMKDMSKELQDAPKTSKKSESQPNYADDIKALRRELTELKETTDTVKSFATKGIDKLRKEIAAVNGNGANHVASHSSSNNNNDVEEEIEELRKEIKTIKSSFSSAKDVKELRRELEELKALKNLSTELTEMRREIKALKGTANASKEIEGLRSEVETIRRSTISPKEFEALRREMATVQATTTTTSSDVAATKKEEKPKSYTMEAPTTPNGTSKPKVSKTPKTPKTPKSPKSPGKAAATSVKLSAAPNLMSPNIDSPTKAPKAAAVITKVGKPGGPNHKPHTVEEMFDAQKKDPVLKEYIKTKKGLPYLYSDMTCVEHTTESGEKKHLVLFSHRYYIPAALREATMQYLLQKHPYDSSSAVQQNCIWPECEKQIKEFKEKNRT